MIYASYNLKKLIQWVTAWIFCYPKDDYLLCCHFLWVNHFLLLVVNKSKKAKSAHVHIFVLLLVSSAEQLHCFWVCFLLNRGLTWGVEETGHFAVIRQFLFTVLRLLNNGQHLLFLRRVVKVDWILVYACKWSESGQFCVVVLDHHPCVLLCRQRYAGMIDANYTTRWKRIKIKETFSSISSPLLGSKSGFFKTSFI